MAIKKNKTSAKKQAPKNPVSKGSTTTKAKASKSKEAKLDKKNVSDTVEQIVETRRQVKYKYPEDINTPVKRKAFRQVVRKKLRSFERKINDPELKGKNKIKKEYKAYRQEVLLVP